MRGIDNELRTENDCFQTGFPGGFDSRVYLMWVSHEDAIAYIFLALDSMINVYFPNNDFTEVF